MRPCSEADRYDAPWLIGEAVPGEAAMVEDVVVGFEDGLAPLKWRGIVSEPVSNLMRNEPIGG